MQIIEGLQQLVVADVAWSDGPGWTLGGLLLAAAVMAVGAWKQSR